MVNPLRTLPILAATCTYLAFPVAVQAQLGVTYHRLFIAAGEHVTWYNGFAEAPNPKEIRAGMTDSHNIPIDGFNGLVIPFDMNPPTGKKKAKCTPKLKPGEKMRDDRVFVFEAYEPYWPVVENGPLKATCEFL